MIEICDNALDDDNDGKIDIQDEDCQCEILEPESLIPNPSFEEMECCPQSRSNLDCANTWIQASEATTDYLHTCGWMGWENLPPPTPFPDGEACIGFRDGRFGGDEPNPNWKEYTGACLTDPLRAGNTYRFEFYIGFTNPANSPPLSVAFFGSQNCENLPFGVGDDRHGCPLNGPGWQQLDQVFAFGANNWSKYWFDVTPDQDIFAIAIGPDCFMRMYTENPYYFLDNLILADVKEFEFEISSTTHVCDPAFALSLPEADSLTYQWYRDGIALVGETGASISGTLNEGLYQVRLIGQNTCRITKPYQYSKPKIENQVQAHFCQGDDYDFNGQTLNLPGVYFDTLKTPDGCDSIVQLDLQMAEPQLVEVNQKIFEGEVLQIGPHEFSTPTSDQSIHLVSAYGCDSTVNLNLTYYQLYIPSAFSPNGDGINDYWEVFGGTDFEKVTSLEIFDRWGARVFRCTEADQATRTISWDGLVQNRSYRSNVFVYKIQVVMDDGLEHLLTGSLTMIK